MLTIRDITENDRQIFIEMGREFYGSPACNHGIPEEYFEATLQECLRSKTYARVLMLEDEGEIVGYFNMSVTWSNEAGGKVIWLEELFFKEASRGKGYGTQVFAWVEKEYPDAKRFRLEVTLENERAIALYKKLGYEELPYLQMIKGN